MKGLATSPKAIVIISRRDADGHRHLERNGQHVGILVPLPNTERAKACRYNLRCPSGELLVVKGQVWVGTQADMRASFS